MRLSDLGGVVAAGWGEVADLLRAQLAIVAAVRLLRSRVSGDVVAWGNAGQQAWHSREVERMRKLAHTVIRVASHGPMRANSLVRALAIQRLLLREELGPGRICVGVRRCDGGVDAHAWVEVGDLILGERPARAPEFGSLDAKTIAST
jgi:hypothetical protein